MPDVITLLEKIYMISRTWYVDTDFVNAFFSIPTIKKKKDKAQFTFTWN